MAEATTATPWTETSRYDVSDLPYLILIALLDDLETRMSAEFDTTVSERQVV